VSFLKMTWLHQLL